MTPSGITEFEVEDAGQKETPWNTTATQTTPPPCPCRGAIVSRPARQREPCAIRWRSYTDNPAALSL